MDSPERRGNSNFMDISDDGVECVEYYPASQYPEEYDLPDDAEAPADVDCQSSAEDPNQVLMKLEARFDHQREQTEHGFRWVVGQIQQILTQQTTDTYQELETQIRELQVMLKEKDDHIQELEKDYGRVTSAHKVALSEVKRLKSQSTVQHKGDGPSLVNSSKVSDADIIGQWKQLHYNIRVLASELAHEPPSGPLCLDAQETMFFIQENYQQMLQDASMRDELLQAYIWALLTHDIWAERENIRESNLVSSLKRVRYWLSVAGMRKEDHRQSQSWLASGFTHFTSLEPVSGTALRALTSKRFGSLSPFISALPTPVRSRVSKQLYDIYKDAVDIDMVFLTSKASVYMERVDPGEPADKNIMDLGQGVTADGDSKSRVLFMISPLLQKWGNANGDDMDKSMVLAKATVVLCPEA